MVLLRQFNVKLESAQSSPSPLEQDREVNMAPRTVFLHDLLERFFEVAHRFRYTDRDLKKAVIHGTGLNGDRAVQP